MSDSWMARYEEAQFAGRYLMSSVLMTSTMKSEPGTPPILLVATVGVPVSAAAICIVGGSAEGARGAGSAALAAGVTALVAPAATTPARNLRRSGLVSMRSSPLKLREF